MTDLLMILSKAFWCGCAALGFGILFNTPNRVLSLIWLGGFLAGLIKFLLLDTGTSSSIILSTFAASATVGIISIYIAQWRQVPTIVFIMPCVIPLVPGVFAYRTMLGLMKLSGEIGNDYSAILSETVRSGVITLFIMMGIAIGALIPTLIPRKNQAPF